jgi:PAS domain S-box-containing protein
MHRQVTMDPRICLTIFQNLPQIIIMIRPDFDVVYINRVAGKYTMNDLIGKKIIHFILPEYQEEYIKIFLNVVRTKESRDIELKAPTSINPGGLTWYKTHLIPILDDQGAVEFVLSVSEHIEAQIRAEEEVITTQRNLEAIINNTDDIIVSIDKNRNLIAFNEVFRLMVKHGYNQDPKKGDDVLLYLDPTKHEKYKSIYLGVYKGENVIDIERFSGRDGTDLYFEASFNPLRNHKNEIYGITIFTRNISKRIAHDNILKQALEEKEILLSEIHHRIKNNLAVISSMLQIQSLCNTNQEISNALGETQLRIKSAAIVHELLYEQKLFSNISVKQFLSLLLREIKRTYSTEGVEFQISGDDFAVDLEQAVPFALMMNELYTNAFKHGFLNKEVGNIHTIIGVIGKQYSVSIYEDGAPFPPHMSTQNSTSVGMILIDAFVAQLNGKIEFRKTSPKEIHLTFSPE